MSVGRETLKLRAARLRSEQTPAERALWQRLRLRQICGVRSLRQYVAGGFILDFYAPSIRLAVELDGGQHYDASHTTYDAARDDWLRAHAIMVLRYSNLEVMRQLDDVLRDVERAVGARRAHPPAASHRPPSCGRG